MKAEMSKKVRLLPLVFTRKDAVLGIDLNLNRPIDCGLSGIGAFRILSVWENSQEYALFNSLADIASWSQFRRSYR
jgi:hypothetical protein